MSVHLVLAPAGAGKTAYALERARAVTRRLEGPAYVCVASRLQAQSCRRRLAQAGGAMGVHAVTFDGLAAACLDVARVPYCALAEAVQHRLLRSVVRGLDLPFYGRLAGSPGLVNLLSALVEALAGADATPDRLEAALAGAEPRLMELAHVFRAYREYGDALGAVDHVALLSLARDAVLGYDGPAADSFGGWSLLAVDGFDSFTPAQLGLLRALASRLPEVIVTLTGEAGAGTPLVWRRFRRTQEDVERALGVLAEPLPRPVHPTGGLLGRLESALRGVAPAAADADVEMLEAPDRAGEAREALRWLKERLVHDALAPGEVAILARDMAAYRPYVLQVAAEMGLPLRMAGGVPLAGVPVIAALVDLLRLALPTEEGTSAPALPRRLVVEAWRSPYFDWQALLPCDGACSYRAGGDAPVRGAAIAGALDAAARWGRVVGGWAQWEEALTRLAAMGATPDAHGAEADDGGAEVSGRVPTGDAALCLLCRLRRFVARASPPESARTLRERVAWLEELIGADDAGDATVANGDGSAAGGMVAAIRAHCAADGAAAGMAARDIEALRALKDVLRGLVAAEALSADRGSVTQAEFFDELVGALEVARLDLPPLRAGGAVLPSPGDGEGEVVLAADVVAARGLPFRAVALLGLAEGEFPASLGEDVLLRDADRRALRAQGIFLELPTESVEPERFYEAVTRASHRLLLTRPRLADNGAAWAPSPFWEEMRRLTAAEPVTLTSESAPPPDRAASWPELLASLATYPTEEEACVWARERCPQRWVALEWATRIVRVRSGEGPASPHDGDLSARRAEFAVRYGPLHVWSATRLEQYRACPFMFFVGSVLQLEPRVEPVEGLDGRQLGAIYHRLFEAYYREDGPPCDTAQWVERVAKPILDEAPARDGFRETAWWPQTRDEILRNVLRSLDALAACSGGYVEVLCERYFGDDRPLVLRDGDDALRLQGLIDRIDRDAQGGARIIDYKTAGRSDYDKRAVASGSKVQLPLYALAARDALGLGEPVEGFYWHVQDAERSGFTLRSFDGGPEGAMAVAAAAAWEAARAVRRGEFAPRPPRGGCVSYCPAAAFCWRYRPRYA